MSDESKKELSQQDLEKIAGGVSGSGSTSTGGASSSSTGARTRGNRPSVSHYTSSSSTQGISSST